jgi:hypothetical protein
LDVHRKVHMSLHATAHRGDDARSLEGPMTDIQRLWLRLRGRAVRYYELLLYALLLSLAFAVMFAAAEAAEDAVQCGSSPSSTGVMIR